MERVVTLRNSVLSVFQNAFLNNVEDDGGKGRSAGGGAEGNFHLSSWREILREGGSSNRARTSFSLTFYLHTSHEEQTKKAKDCVHIFFPSPYCSAKEFRARQTGKCSAPRISPVPYRVMDRLVVQMHAVVAAVAVAAERVLPGPDPDHVPHVAEGLGGVEHRRPYGGAVAPAHAPADAELDAADVSGVVEWVAGRAVGVGVVGGAGNDVRVVRKRGWNGREKQRKVSNNSLF